MFFEILKGKDMGPLVNLKVIEFQGIGPGPYCGMMLADMGAEVIRVDRIPFSSESEKGTDFLGRGRQSIALDLKHPEGRTTALRLIDASDILIEGFRPGVMERIGLGPDICLARNEGLVYGRMTGWGQTGTLSSAAGHDINYISLSGVLHAIGHEEEKPTVPLNLVGDFGGGGMLLAFGILAAIYERSQSGKGQVVDAAMTEGSALLMNAIFGLMNSGTWSEARGTNLLDGGSHFYNTYETSDGKFISIGAIEPKFYSLLLEKLGIGQVSDLPNQMARQDWPGLKKKFSEIFKTKSRDEWDELMMGTDICYAPVLSYGEAKKHPHNISRGTFVERDGGYEAAPAPRFSRSSPKLPESDVPAGSQSIDILRRTSFSDDEINGLIEQGVVVQN